MRRGLLVIAGLALAMGCQNKEQLQKALADAQTLNAEKDSLLTEVLETSKFVASVSEELAKARSIGVAPVAAGEHGPPGVEADRAARAVALQKVNALVSRLNETETKLEQSSARARSLSGRNSGLVKQLDEYKHQVEDLRASAERQATELGAVIDSQRVQIATISEERDTLQTQTVSLAAERVALNDSVGKLTTVANTAYFVAGTEEKLIKSGVVEKEGSKFLFFGGKQLHPARELNPDGFTTIDQSHDLVIPMPNPEKSYKLISRQSLAFVDSADVVDGKVKGQLHITSPEQFWAGSRYLILVED